MEILNPARTIDYIVALIGDGQIDRARALTRDPHIEEIVAAKTVHWGPHAKTVPVPVHAPIKLPPPHTPYKEGHQIKAEKFVLDPTTSHEALTLRGLTPVTDTVYYPGILLVDSAPNVEYVHGTLVAKHFIAADNPLTFQKEPAPTYTREAIRGDPDMSTHTWNGHSVNPPDVTRGDNAVIPPWWPCWDMVKNSR